MNNSYGTWNQIFWLFFIGLGLIIILISRLNVFFMELFMGLIIIALGIQKIAEDKNFKYLYMRQKETDKNLKDMSSFIDRTYRRVNPDEESIERDSTSFDLDTTKKEIEKKIDDDIERLAKKMIQLENKINGISRSIVDNWGRVQEQQFMSQVQRSAPKTTAKTTPKKIKSTKKANNELKKKLEKAMGG